MNLNQLYYFKTLAELEHYTKAAEKLNISQPTLSHSISSMEKELGANLFEKQGRNVVLTKYGRIYMFYVENALTQLELGKNQIERLVSEGGGHVGLAYMTSVGTNFVPGLIAGFLDDPQNKNISFSWFSAPWWRRRAMWNLFLFSSRALWLFCRRGIPWRIERR